MFQFILGFTLLDFKRSSYGDYTYPVYADVIGALISITEIAFIPGVAIYKIATVSDKTLSLMEVRFFSCIIVLSLIAI